MADFLLVFLLLAAPPLRFASARDLALDDGRALISAKKKWNLGASLPTWDGSDHCHGWEGVVCNEELRVISLNLSNHGIKGPLPDDIGQLDALISLDLSNSKSSSGPWNNITGNLASIGNLKKLQLLNMSFNYLDTDFPESILKLTNLVFLKLDNAGVRGSFPAGLTRLTKLQELFLGNNTLRGPLPQGLSNLVNLVELSLWDNDISTSIPVEISTLVNLTYLNMHGCDMWGGLPAEFENLLNMRMLHLYDNQLSGTIPETWSNLRNLSSLRLEYNYLTKFFPFWTQTLSSLEHLDLQHNLLYGSVEKVILKHAKLVDIKCNYFSGNQLTSTNATLVEDKGNCFIHTNQEDKKRCSQDFYTCDDFAKHVKYGDCAGCPPNQYIHDAVRCVCEPAGMQGDKHRTSSVGKLIVTILILALLVVILITCLMHKQRKKLLAASGDPHQEVQMFLYNPPSEEDAM